MLLTYIYMNLSISPHFSLQSSTICVDRFGIGYDFLIVHRFLFFFLLVRLISNNECEENIIIYQNLH